MTNNTEMLRMIHSMVKDVKEDLTVLRAENNDSHSTLYGKLDKVEVRSSTNETQIKEIKDTKNRGYVLVGIVLSVVALSLDLFWRFLYGKP